MDYKRNIDVCLDLLTDLKVRFSVALIGKQGEMLAETINIYNRLMFDLLARIEQYRKDILSHD